MQTAASVMYGVRMSRRHQRRRAEKARRHAAPSPIASSVPGVAVRIQEQVDRLAYTRTQAAEALGVSRATFDRRVLPHIETIETRWGTQLVPVDELERLVAEGRRPARERWKSPAKGHPPAVPADLAARIAAEQSAGKSLGQIARDLNASGTPTAQGGAQWWPLTVRSVICRQARLRATDVSR